MTQVYFSNKITRRASTIAIVNFFKFDFSDVILIVLWSAELLTFNTIF